jgi:hypothetical protein
LSHKLEGTLKRDYHHIGHVEGDAVNQDAILAVLCDSKDNAKSLKEIALEMGLDISSYVDWVRVERRLSSSLRSLTRWGWVAWERRQREEGHRFWYNAYWKTELANGRGGQ